MPHLKSPKSPLFFLGIGMEVHGQVRQCSPATLVLGFLDLEGHVPHPGVLHTLDTVSGAHEIMQHSCVMLNVGGSAPCCLGGVGHPSSPTCDVTIGAMT